MLRFLPEAMPKKTKKDKIKAFERRKQLAKNLISYNFVKPQSIPNREVESKQSAYDSIKKELPSMATQTDIFAIDSRHLKRDLVKILIFTFFALIIQVVLYYLLRG